MGSGVLSEKSDHVIGIPVLAAFYLAMAWAMTYHTLRLPLYLPAGDVAGFFAGHVPRPYQYRILGPWIIQTLGSFTGLDRYWSELVYYVSAYLFLFFVFRTWLRTWLPRAAADLAPVWICAAFVGNLLPRYPWDPLGVALLALLLIAIHARRWLLFFPLLVLATLNRETALLAVASLFFVERFLRREGWGRTLSLTASAAGIWLAVKAVLYVAYRDSPGGALEWHLAENAAIFMGESAYVDYLQNEYLKRIAGVFPLCWLQFLVALNGFWIPALVRWRSKDPFLKISALAAPLLLAAVVLFGNIAERRVYLDLAPWVLPLALATFFPKATGGSDDPSSPNGKVRGGHSKRETEA